MAGNGYLTSNEQALVGNSRSDMCANGTLILKSGGGVKGTVDYMCRFMPWVLDPFFQKNPT